MKLSVKTIYDENRPIFRVLWWFLGCILACRLTGGAFVGVIALAGVWGFSRNRPGVTLAAYMAITLLIPVSTTLRGSGGFFYMLCRICPIGLMVLMVMQAPRRHGSFVLPLGMLYAYLGIAVVSSFGGWCPPVSFMKIVNFLVFLLGIHFGVRNLQGSPQDLQLLRNGMMAFCVFIIAGSIAVIPFPSIGYSMFIDQMSMWTAIDDAGAFMSRHQGMALFSGVTVHSQTLSPLAVACTAYILCDMMFVERRLSALHMVLLGLAPIVLFMTHSRLALLGFAADTVVLLHYTIPKARVSVKVKAAIRKAFKGIIVAGVIGLAVMQVRDQSFTKWLRKTDDVESDSRDLTEAVTSSRRGLIEENMYDFHKNPALGMGFQTCELHRLAYEKGQVNAFSAPIEKGVLPVMVLGETGVVGAVVFAVFLIAFYGTCLSRRFVCTVTLMTVFLFLNMAEASFFSPGGLGGALWVLLVGGGFLLDMMNVYFTTAHVANQSCVKVKGNRVRRPVSVNKGRTSHNGIQHKSLVRLPPPPVHRPIYESFSQLLPWGRRW